MLLPEVLNSQTSSALWMGVLQLTVVPFIVGLNRVNVMVDSKYSSLVYFVRTALIFMWSRSFITTLWLEELSKIISIGICSGKVISHFRNMYSRFDWIEQLNTTVSPGQSMEGLALVLCARNNSTDSRKNIPSLLSQISASHNYVKGLYICSYTLQVCMHAWCPWSL